MTALRLCLTDAPHSAQRRPIIEKLDSNTKIKEKIVKTIKFFNINWTKTWNVCPK